MLTHGLELTIDEEVIEYVTMARDLKMSSPTFLRNISVILAGDEWHLVGEADWNDVREILADHPELLTCFESYLAARTELVTPNE